MGSGRDILQTFGVMYVICPFMGPGERYGTQDHSA